MGLQNIFEMAKADRYTADGREELAKAREADVEDRTYNIGEISAKTGLQKTANGWVKPAGNKAESNSTASKSPEASFKSTKPAGTIEKGKVFIDRFGGSESLKVDEVGSDGSFSYTITKSDGSKASGKASNEKELRHILTTSGYGERTVGSGSAEERYKAVKSELEKRNGGSSESQKLIDSLSEWGDNKMPPAQAYGDLVRFAERHDKDFSRSKVGSYTAGQWRDYLKSLTPDSAPRALTGDCKVRVRK